MFNHETGFFLKNKYNDVAKKRKRNETILKTSFDDYKNDEFWYDILTSTIIKIEQRKFFVHNKNVLKDFTKLFGNVFIYKKMKIYFSIKIWSKFMRISNIKDSLFHRTLINLSRIIIQKQNIIEFNYSKDFDFIILFEK